LISTTYQDSDGEFRDSHKGVFLKLLDGTERDFFEIATNVVNMWCGELYSIGVLEKPRKFEHARRKEPLTREECDMSFVLNFEIAAPANLMIKMLKYNYDKHIIEPNNISDKDFKLSIYEKDRYIAEARLVGPDEYISVEIPLTHEEVLEIQSYRTDEERQVVLFEKALNQGITQASLFKTDGTPKLGTDGKPMKLKFSLTPKGSEKQ